MQLRFLTGRDSSKHCVLQALITEEIRDEHGISRWPKWVDVPVVAFEDTEQRDVGFVTKPHISTFPCKVCGEPVETTLPQKAIVAITCTRCCATSRLAPSALDLPWKYDKSEGVLSDKHDGGLVAISGYTGADLTDEQCEFITQACNSYHRREALLREGLRLLKQWTTPEEAGQDPQEWEAFVEQCEAELKGGE